MSRNRKPGSQRRVVNNGTNPSTDPAIPLEQFIAINRLWRPIREAA